MSNGCGPSIAGLILTEARELRRKQDERLRGLQALSRGILAGFLSAGLIALAAQPASDPISHEFGLSITYTAVGLVIMTLLVELSASRWKEGTDVEALDYFSHEATRVEDFEMSHALTHEGHRKHNEKLPPPHNHPRRSPSKAARPLGRQAERLQRLGAFEDGGGRVERGLLVGAC